MKKTDRLWVIFCSCILGYFLTMLFVIPILGTNEIQVDLEIIQVEITAYSPSPHITMGDPFTMASGRKANPGDLDKLKFVAVSRDLMEEYGLRYGDTIWIGFIVEDTMNKRITRTVDLFMRNLDLARKFGRQEREIIILRR